MAHALRVCLHPGIVAGGDILDAQLVGGGEQGGEAGGIDVLPGQSLGVEGDALHVQLLGQRLGRLCGGVLFGGVGQPDDGCRHGKALLLQDADRHAAAHASAQAHQDPVLLSVGVEPVPGQKSIVHRALRKLKPEYRQILWLIYFEDFSNKEAAAVMKKSVHNVETLVYRARKSLKSQLEMEGFVYEKL